MAPETWLIKVKASISKGLGAAKSGAGAPAPPRRVKVGVLAFEIAGVMSKLLQLWQSLSDRSIIHLRNEGISLEGVRKMVSNDESFLLGLACAETVEALRAAAAGVARLCSRCEDPSLRGFERALHEFANLGKDPHEWVLNPKEMDAKNKKMEHYVVVTTALYKEMEELAAMEGSLRKSIQEWPAKEQKILWQRQEVKYLKERSLWNRSFDTACSVLVRSIFTILARIKLVFGIGQRHPSSLPRSLSASAAVHPTGNPNTFVSKAEDGNFFDSNSKLLKPPSTTLGAAALALHYANLIIVMEKMIRSPQLVGVDARDDLYAMLPNSVRSSLRARLKGVGFSATDPVLAAEWREALARILEWLSPLAHNMIKWQSDRSFEQQNQSLTPKTNVLLLQTLCFANKDKTEAAITELLVGLNYIWRFEREMTARLLFQNHALFTFNPR